MNEIDDSELYTTWFSEVCCHCRHFNRDAPTHTCTAFPDGIPRAIWDGEHHHDRPYPGDRDVQFEPNQPNEEE
jgi:hypothetical protein